MTVQEGSFSLVLCWEHEVLKFQLGGCSNLTYVISVPTSCVWAVLPSILCLYRLLAMMSLLTFRVYILHVCWLVFLKYHTTNLSLVCKTKRNILWCCPLHFFSWTRRKGAYSYIIRTKKGIRTLNEVRHPHHLDYKETCAPFTRKVDHSLNLTLTWHKGKEIINASCST